MQFLNQFKSEKHNILYYMQTFYVQTDLYYDRIFEQDWLYYSNKVDIDTVAIKWYQLSGRLNFAKFLSTLVWYIQQKTWREK